MKITLKRLTIKNLMTIGNVPQEITLNDNLLTLIVGRNKDINVEGSTNGVGKSTIVHGLCYAMYGEPLTDDIKKDRLINFANKKNLEVCLEFDKDGISYKIERGRKPTYNRLYISDVEYDEKDETQGTSKSTQEVIDDLFCMSYDMAKHIMILDTFNKPFLSLKEVQQRPIIEELLGITLLSKKAESIKTELKLIKSEIKTEEGKLSAYISNNDRIEKSIETIKFKKDIWDKDKVINLERMSDKIDILKKIDIEQELKNHELMEKIKNVEQDFNNIHSAIKTIEMEREALDSKIKRKQSDLDGARAHSCPECGQEIHNDIFEKIIENLTNELNDLLSQKNNYNEDMPLLEDEFIVLSDKLNEYGSPPELYYRNIHDVYEHKQTLEKMEYMFSIEIEKENPYEVQIQNLKEKSLVDIDYTTMNDLTNSKDHMEFLIKLLTSSESFIRKKIIEQNIKVLNKKLAFYLDKMMLPHRIEFKNDLTVSIIKSGNEYDFGQLSKGEKNRVMISVSWAFRETWESLNGNINIWFYDEVIDTGMDTQGIMSAIDILNGFVGEMKKDIFLISHKTDLIANIENVLYAIKENDFTTYEYTE